jgi:hypothetical protein
MSEKCSFNTYTNGTNQIKKAHTKGRQTIKASRNLAGIAWEILYVRHQTEGRRATRTSSNAEHQIRCSKSALTFRHSPP